MKLLISILLSIALCNAQTIEITIPGRQNSNGGGGGSSIGLVIGALVGLGISLLITNAVFGKAKPDVQKNGDKGPAFLPGYFIVVFEGPLDLSSLGEVEDFLRERGLTMEGPTPAGTYLLKGAKEKDVQELKKRGYTREVFK